MVINESINQTVASAVVALVPKADPHIIGLPAVVVILFISILVAVISNLAYKYATDQAMIRQVREDIKKHQENLKAQVDPQKKLEIQNQITSLSMKLMPQTFKPMLVTIVPFLIIFTLLNRLYTNVPIIPLSFNLFGKPWLGWFGMYLIFSLVFMQVFKKLLNVAQ